MTTNSTPMISVKNLGKKLEDQQILDGLSFEVNPGEVFVLMGPSGCGKTTTLRLIAGLEQPDWGEIALNNKTTSTPTLIVPPHKRSLSMVFQDLVLWPHMSIWQHIHFALDSKKYRGKQIKNKIDTLLNLVQLKNRKAYPHQLSGGEQQRLAIARALASEPDILLLDEPLSNMDVELKEQLLKEIKRLARQLKITVLYVTHQPEEAMSLADTVGTMDHTGITSLLTVGDFIKKQQKLWEQNALAYQSTDKVIPLRLYQNMG